MLNVIDIVGWFNYMKLTPNERAYLEEYNADAAAAYEYYVEENDDRDGFLRWNDTHEERFEWGYRFQRPSGPCTFGRVHNSCGDDNSDSWNGR